MSRFTTSPYEPLGSELQRNSEGDLYFSATFLEKKPTGEQRRFFRVNVEMSGERWLREQGFSEGDRLFREQIDHLREQRWLYTKKGTLPPLSSLPRKSVETCAIPGSAGSVHTVPLRALTNQSPKPAMEDSRRDRPTQRAAAPQPSPPAAPAAPPRQRGAPPANSLESRQSRGMAINPSWLTPRMVTRTVEGGASSTAATPFFASAAPKQSTDRSTSAQPAQGLANSRPLAVTSEGVATSASIASPEPGSQFSRTSGSMPSASASVQDSLPQANWEDWVLHEVGEEGVASGRAITTPATIGVPMTPDDALVGLRAMPERPLTAPPHVQTASATFVANSPWRRLWRSLVRKTTGRGG